MASQDRCQRPLGLMPFLRSHGPKTNGSRVAQIYTAASRVYVRPPQTSGVRAVVRIRHADTVWSVPDGGALGWVAARAWSFRQGPAPRVVRRGEHVIPKGQSRRPDRRPRRKWSVLVGRGGRSAGVSLRPRQVRALAVDQRRRSTSEIELSGSVSEPVGKRRERGMGRALTDTGLE